MLIIKLNFLLKIFLNFKLQLLTIESVKLIL